MIEHAANGIELAMPSQKEEENQVIVCSNTMAGLRDKFHVAVAYTVVRLSGNGAVAIHNLMEDAATAEISRASCLRATSRPSSSTARACRAGLPRALARCLYRGLVCRPPSPASDCLLLPRGVQPLLHDRGVRLP